MNYKEAAKLKEGDKVWVNYKPMPGHGKAINEMGIVKGGPHDADKPNMNMQGTKYIGIVVYVPSEGHSSVYPSIFLTLKQ